MDVEFKRLLIKKSLEIADAELARGNMSLYQIFENQADRLEREVAVYLKENPECLNAQVVEKSRGPVKDSTKSSSLAEKKRTPTKSKPVSSKRPKSPRVGKSSKR